MIEPNFKGGEPLFIPSISDGKVPALAEDECECCDKPCLPCVGVCTSGWASLNVSVSGCDKNQIITLTDTSVPPPGFCYSGSSFSCDFGASECGELTANPRVRILRGEQGNCFTVQLTSYANCCDFPSHCGSCVDTTSRTISTQYCCCYGGHCEAGVPQIEWPAFVAVTMHQFFSAWARSECTQAAYSDFWNAHLPGTFICPFIGETNGIASYQLQLLGVRDCAEHPGCVAYVQAIAQLTCDGLRAATVGCGLWKPATSSLCTGTWNRDVGYGAYLACHGTVANLNAFNRVDTGALENLIIVEQGVTVTW